MVDHEVDEGVRPSERAVDPGPVARQNGVNERCIGNIAPQVHDVSCAAVPLEHGHPGAGRLGGKVHTDRDHAPTLRRDIRRYSASCSTSFPKFSPLNSIARVAGKSATPPTTTSSRLFIEPSLR